MRLLMEFGGISVSEEQRSSLTGSEPRWRRNQMRDSGQVYSRAFSTDSFAFALLHVGLNSNRSETSKATVSHVQLADHAFAISFSTCMASLLYDSYLKIVQSR